MESSSTKGNIRHGKLKSQKELKKITDSEEYKKSDYEGKTKKLNVATANKGMSVGQAKIAAKAPPPNKIDAKDFAVLRSEKAKGRGMGLQDEKVQPGKVMKANLGTMATKLISKFMGKKKSASSDNSNMASSGKGMSGMLPKLLQKAIDDGTIKTAKHGKMIKARVGKSVTRIPLAGKSTSVGSTTMKGMKFSDKAKMVDAGKINKATGKFTSMEALRESIGYRPAETSEKFNKRQTAMAAAKKAARASRIGKIALGVGTAGVAASQYLKSKMNKKKDVKKKMGGGMMQRPMGYTTGGPSSGFRSKQDRKKAEKNIKLARSKEGLRSYLSSGNKHNQPMRKERYMEGRKARHTEFKKKIAGTALSIASTLNPVTAVAKGIKKIIKPGKKKRDFQKGDYGDISVKKNMGGMMMPRPMGYKDGTKPGTGPMSKMGKAGRARQVRRTQAGKLAIEAGPRAMQARKTQAGLSQTPKERKERPALVVQFGVPEGPAKQNTTIKTVKVKNRDELKKTLSSRMSGGMMQRPMGYRSGTMVKARGCKLGRTRPTKIT